MSVGKHLRSIDLNSAVFEEAFSEGECVRRTDFWSNESGSAVIERAILACVVALVIVNLIGSGLTPAEFLQRAALLTDALIATDGRPRAPLPAEE